MSPLFIVHLIHGTYASRAPWIQKDGVLAKELEAAYPESIIVEPCEWTGGNSWDARAEAADKLRERVEQLNAVYPSAKQILIAHSHGGNVALYAMGQMQHPNCIVGCACLATPFINARSRTAELFTEAHLGLPIVLILWLVVVLVEPTLFDFSWKALIAFVICLFIGLVCGSVILGALQACTRVADKMAVVLQADTPDTVAMLIVRKVGDEASMSLASSQFIAWLTTKAYEFFAEKKALGKGKYIRRGSLSWPLRWIWFVVTLALSVEMLGHPFFSARYDIAHTGLNVLAAVLLFVTIALRTKLLDGIFLSFCLFALAVSKVLNAFTFGVVPYGSDKGSRLKRVLLGSLLSVLLDVEAGGTPVGFHAVVQLDRDSAGSNGLNHSLYEDARARSLLIEWIKRFKVEATYGSGVI